MRVLHYFITTSMQNGTYLFSVGLFVAGVKGIYYYAELFCVFEQKKLLPNI